MVAVGAGLNAIVFVATMVVGFFLTPFMIRELGKAQYDVWCIVEAVLAYFTLLDLGVAAYLMRLTARSVAQSTLAPLNRAASAAMAVFACGSVVILAVGGGVLFALADSLRAKADDPTTLPLFLALMLFNLVCLLPLSVFPAMLDGLERFSTKAGIRFVFLIVRTVAMVMLLQRGNGLLGVGVVVFLGTMAEQLVLAAACLHARPGLRVAPWAAERAAMREAITAGVDAFLAMLSGRVTLQTGAILIGLFLPEGRVTDYAMAARLSEYAKQLLRQLTTTLTPGISALEARNDWDGIRQVFLRGTYWVLLLSLPVQLGLWCYGRPFLSAWVGAEFASSSGTALMILAGTVTLGLMQSVAARVLYGLGQLRFFARVTLVEGVVNVALTLLLIEPYGIAGVAIAVAVPNVLSSLVIIIYVMWKLNVTWRSYVRVCLQPCVCGVVPLAVWCLLPMPAASYVEIGLCILAGLVPYAACALPRRWPNRSWLLLPKINSLSKTK